MIGMMYLVLTALLAMNISKDVLDAFVQVDHGLHDTKLIAESKSKNSMATLSASSNPQKAAPFLKVAQEIEKESEDILNYLNEFKARTISASHGDPKGETYQEFMVDGHTVLLDATNEDGDRYVTKPDDNQSNTTLLIGDDPGAPRTDPWSANELKGKLEAFRDKVTAIQLKEVTGKTWKLPEALKLNIEEIFNFEDVMAGHGNEEPKPTKWETHNFYHVPLAAIMPILTKIEVDVENAKADVITALSAGVEGSSFKFTKLVPIVMPGKTYVLRGDSIHAEILLAAYDDTNPPKIMWNESGYTGENPPAFNESAAVEMEMNEAGLGVINIPTKSMSLGTHGYQGVIKYKGPDGKDLEYPFNTPNFTVSEPALVVSPTKMNVFYRGLPNPVEVSVPGVRPDAVFPTCSGASMTKGSNGEWVVKPGGNSTKATISVSADITGTGQKVSMGTKEFRIKPIPDPVPSFNGKSPTDNTIKLSDAQNASGLRAEMVNFDFDVDVKVVEFTMVFTRGSEVIEKKATSNRLTDAMKANLKKLRRGEQFYLNNIMVKMPDGKKRKVSNITLKAV